MRVLSFIVEDQMIRKDPACDFTNLISGTGGYLKARFVFNQEWRGYTTIAVFRKLSSEYPVPIINGECIIPGDTLESDWFKVKVIGQKKAGQRLTTNEVEVKQTGGNRIV